MDETAPAAAGPGAERVQQLLSRAVEAQLAEQRSAAAELAELRRQIAGQTAALEHVGTALRAVAALPDALRGLQREVAGLHDRLAALTAERAVSPAPAPAPASAAAAPAAPPAAAASTSGAAAARSAPGGAAVEEPPGEEDVVTPSPPGRAPVQPRPEVSARFAAASNVFGTPSDGADGGPRRRAWWKPGI